MRVLALILGLCAVAALLACGGSGSTSSTITAVTVSCSPASVQSGQQSQCTPTVTGTGAFSNVVSWGTSGGTIDGNGLLTAQAVTSSIAVTITAVSSQDPTKSGTATVTVTPVTAISVSCTPTQVQPRQLSTCISTANGVSTTTVDWSSSIGTITAGGLFTAPQVASSTPVTITAVTEVTNVKGTTTVTVNVNNTASLAVDGGPTVNGTSVNNPNGAYTTVSVCLPSGGITTCTNVDHVLVDTGSVGFRVLSSALGSVSPPGLAASDGNALAECYVRPDGYAWGPVSQATVQVSGEIATAIPVQVIAPSGFAAAPASCTGQTTGGALDTVSALKANGILGIGVFVQDCGTACTGGTLPNTYYSCPSSTCNPIAVPTAQQVSNPVASFPNDNNGSLIQLPPVFAAGSTGVTGSLIFGIGTQPNNAMNSVTVYGVNASGVNAGTFTSSYSGTSFPGSLSSGASANYFLNSAATSIPACTDSGFYCPSSPTSVTVNNTGTNGTSGSVTLPVANADSLIGSGNLSFDNLAGPGTGITSGFIYGLPFFYGRSVFTAINGASTPGGTGPYFAF